MIKGYAYFIVLFLIAFPRTVCSLESHCKKQDETIFNCQLRNSKKIISICKIGTEGSGQQYIQYTFGKIGKPELIFPQKNQITENNFSFDRQYSNAAGYLEYDINFSIGHNSYNVYWMEISKEDGVPTEDIDISSGVSASTKNGKSIDFPCNNDAKEDFMSAITIFVRNVKWANE